MLEKVLRIAKKIIPRPIFVFFQPFYHWLLNFLAAAQYGWPARKITMIGITGTNGKSTVVNLLAEILEEAGIKTASISSLRFRIGEKEWPNALKMTMPGRFFLQKFLARAKKSGVSHAVIEVTSEGIRQFRHKNVKWRILAITNLTPEHIESHGGFENYKQAKGKLFKEPHNVSVVNADDGHAKYFLEFPAEEKITYGIKNAAMIKAENVKLADNEIKFLVGKTEFSLPLLGEFNVYNALAAIAVARALGVSDEKIKLAFVKIKNIPGRMEFIDSGQLFRVAVDYAHTPDSLEKVYRTLKTSVQAGNSGKLICVLGAAGGGRDKWKRPKMGGIAGELCQEIILTNEDPYDEDPIQILSEIKSGISNFQFPISNVYEILDRREAIKKALKSAAAGDVVIITGKGAESAIMGPAGKRIPWDDRAVVKEELNMLK
ncbi:MAG: UDP-N-acetylmuramoyl-L-alanyl-D-glutamate--2,6-diaminopimelate ligase [Candidatus Niyogibacteria bacterium]|nr:UDP-N-acetylmuramoyl-L-alanyl-D-glutamate--2,6-diaminopimelate ligase [Candidatus Niyogibacteria bacterium]